MNSLTGWLLAALMLLASWQAYGWQGVILASTVLLFVLLLQFNRVMRVMRYAAASPIGQVSNAVMLYSKLHRDMTLLQIITQTRSLGRKVSATPETWAWRDEQGSEVTLVFEKAKLRNWTLHRNS
jgi:hypothetical protein